jgi:hypothetical protein
VSTEQRRQLVWYEWQGYTQEIKAAWEARADNLNGREVPGLLLQYPAALGSNSLSIQEAVLKSMSNEWRGFVLKIHRLLKKIPARTNRIWHVRFGNEEVEIRMQKYKTFEFSYLLLLTLFGANFTNLPQCYIVSNTKRQVVIHIDAMEAVRNMFEIKALSAFEVRYEQDVNTMSNDQIIVRTTAGKLTLKRRNTNQQAVGYILRVNGMKWIVILSHNSQTIEMDRLVFDRVSNSYVMVSGVLGGGDLIGNDYNIIKYEPIRFSFSKNHQSPCKCSFNQLGFLLNKVTNQLTILPQYCT